MNTPVSDDTWRILFGLGLVALVLIEARYALVWLWRLVFG